MKRKFANNAEQYYNLPAQYWTDPHINTKKNRKKPHNRVPKKFRYKQKKEE